MSSADLGVLEPQRVWEHFLALTRVPRPPKQEEEVRRHVLDWAGARDLPADVDAAGNVVVRVPPSAGRERAPTVVLQSHLDMVCERDPDSPNDPRAGRIEVVREGDWILAKGTTLGADNGIGVAAAMAVADDADLAHGPLELLFTVSEEQGLDGAKALDPALVTGRVLLNLDGTSDAGITIGCAGSAHAFVRLPLSPAPVPAGELTLEVRVSGLRGGHSGGDIARGRINAVKAVGRILSRARHELSFRLAGLAGGVSRNAIPREASAVVTLRPAVEKSFRRWAGEELASLQEQFESSDGGVQLEVAPVAAASVAADYSTTSRALSLVAATPTGVVAMTPALPGVVETSTSLNVAETEGGVLTLASMIRSASSPALDDVVATLEASADLAGAEIEVRRSYPPWRPDPDSPVLATARSTYLRLFELEPKLDVVHGGLECAVIGDKLPGVEMISIGPNVEGPHAPGERLSVPSTARFYDLLGGLLDDLSR